MNTKIDFQEYDLENGLHIILQANNRKPLVSVGVMYRAGSKNDVKGKSGFAHFFEHLLFEETKNIPRGEWFNIVASHGGINNAFTTKDKTYYYETFPSHHIQLALYLESERMRHPIISQIGVNTQKEVIKEEKRQRISNAPYGKFLYGHSTSPYIFENHPYAQSVIGKMEDIDAATENDFIEYFHNLYNPNNATLVISGNFNINETKAYIQAYFGSIENKNDAPEKNNSKIQPPLYKKITDIDHNISIPLKAFAFQTPAINHPDALVFDFIKTILIGGKSSRLHQELVEKKKMALQVLAFSEIMEEAGSFTIGGLPMGNISLENIGDAIEREIHQITEKPISQREFEKTLNQIETDLASSYKTTHGIALSLASFHHSFNNANYINEQWKHYKDIQPIDIMRVASIYFKKECCIELDYLPSTSQ